MHTNQAHIETQVAFFADECRRANMRVTPQRLEIFRELLKSSDHPAAETLYRRVRTRQPTLSRDTLYRTLATLECTGLVSRVGSATGTARFEANMTPHDHFLCVGCGEIADLPSPDRTEMTEKIELPPGYQLQTIQVESRGLCANCGVAEQD
ncbi:MAG: transcriptional repressor [Candidatus Hydrogenedentes bacterium]|nr:transcriptional repressor [Candidatus Hydrogenedentota bacterium]